MINTPPTRRRRAVAFSLAVVASAALVGAATSSAAPGDVVFAEDFDAVTDGSLPDGFFAAGGDWAVHDGELIAHMADSYAPAVLTFGAPTPDDFRVEFDMRFDAVNSASRWAGLVTDVAPTGAAPWWQAVIRSNGTSVEFAERTATNGWNVTDAATAPAPGVGNDVAVRIDVHGDNGSWYLDDQLVLSTEVMTRSDDGVLGFVMTGGTVAFDDLVVTELEPLPVEPEPELFVLEEHFEGDTLPDGFTPIVGNWSVHDGRLHLDEPTALGRITFGPHLDDFEVSATMRFETVNNSSRWTGIMTDAAADGSVPWSHAVMRSASTAANGIEFAIRTASNGWNVTDRAAAPAAAGVGTDVDVRIVVRGSRGQWYFDDQLVLETNAIARSGDGGLGFIADGARVSIDDLVVRELPFEPISFIREPGAGPVTIAHRGNSSVAPENTLAAFESAIRTGAEMFEIDTYTTADGSNVVMHDGSLDRTTDGTGSTTAVSDDYLRSLDAGSWYSPAYRGQPVPFFEDVLDLADGRGAIVVWEVKHIADEAEMAEAVEQIRARGMEEQVLVQSFNATYLAWARDAGPEIPRAYLSAPGSDPIGLARELELSSWNMSAGWILANPGFVADLHEIGVAVMPYTVNDPATWKALAEISVDGIITDRPAAHVGFRAGSPIDVTVVAPEPTDPVPIAVRLEQAVGQADPASGWPVAFDVVFGESVVGFDDTDIIVDITEPAGGAVETTVSVVEVTPGLRYRALVDAADDPSVTLAVTVPAGAATDAAGTPSSAATSTDNTVEVVVPPEPTAACRVDYTETGHWPGAVITRVELVNTGDLAWNGWELGWTFAGDDQVRSSWSAVVDQQGDEVTVVPATWNGVVEAGETIGFGFISHRTDAVQAPPTEFRLDGLRCAG